MPNEDLIKAKNKLSFYLKGVKNLTLPKFMNEYTARNLIRKYQNFTPKIKAEIDERVNYYNQMPPQEINTIIGEQIKHYNRKDKISAYYFDLLDLTRLYNPEARISYLFGDINFFPKIPSLLKSRPVSGIGIENAVLLKLDSIRHFHVIQDPIPFEKKQPKLVWRGNAFQEHRLEFIKKYHSHPLCDIGDVRNESIGLPFHRPYMTIHDQLKYKYILSMEGNDVATNLKWIMYSNSLCFMRRPRFETWLMEGRLQPGIHYVLLKDDHSDFEDKIRYYERNPSEAFEIIKNAQTYIQEFFNKDKEIIIALKVIDKFLSMTNQEKFILIK